VQFVYSSRSIYVHGNDRQMDDYYWLRVNRTVDVCTVDMTSYNSAAAAAAGHLATR